MERCPDGFDLWVYQRNTDARRLYERLGFRLIELTNGERNKEHEPEARYVWDGATGFRRSAQSTNSTNSPSSWLG